MQRSPRFFRKSRGERLGRDPSRRHDSKLVIGFAAGARRSRSFAQRFPPARKFACSRRMAARRFCFPARPRRCTTSFISTRKSHYWAGEELTPGRPLTLRASSKTDFDKWRTASAADFTQNLRTVLNRAANRPGYFYADADAMPEAPLATLRTISWPRQTILCLGPCTPTAP